MNASDADRPESNDNVPEPPVPSEPGSASRRGAARPEDGNADASDADASDADASDADASDADTAPESADSGERATPEPDAESKIATESQLNPESQANAESQADAEASTAARIPDPIRPAEGQSVDEPSVTFEWERVEQADNYQLQIAKDRGFTEMIFDARVGSSSAFTYSGLPPQEGFTLYWRVRAHIKEEKTWTDFGTVGTFVLADWRPDQPALANAQDVSAPVADAAVGDSSRAEPVLITFSIVVTVIAVGLSIIYMQDSGLSSAAEETEVVETADADTVSLDLKEPVPNEDGETYRISINDAMRQVVRERGGTWQEAPGEPAEDSAQGDNEQQGATQQEEAP